MAIDTATYEIIDRAIILPLNIDTFGVVGDENSKVLQFRTTRYVDAADLSTKDIYVCFRNASQLTGEKPAENIQFTSKLLTFDWFVPSELTAAAGQVELYVEFRVTDEESNKIYVLRTMPIVREIKDTFEIYNNASQADYTVLDSFISQNQEEIDYLDLIDSDLPFKVEDRKILFQPSKIIAVEKDNLSQIMTFRLNRVVDGIDRANMHFSFHFINGCRETGMAAGCNIMHTENEILVSWALDSRVTKAAGTVTFKLHINGALSNGEAYRWNTLEASFPVKASLDAVDDIEIPNLFWFASWEAKTNNAIGQAASYANSAKDYYYKIMNQAANTDRLTTDITDRVSEAQKYSNEAKEAAQSLSSLYTVRSSKDINGLWCIVEYYRPDNTLYMRSSLQADTADSLHYTARLEQYFDLDGTTVKASTAVPITYDPDGNVTGRFGVLHPLLYHFPNQ